MPPSMRRWENQNKLVKEIAPSFAEPSGRPPTEGRRRLERFLFILAALVALLGLADSIYLTVHHLTGQDVGCFASSECETVLGSAYASIGKIPLASFGLAGYFAVFSLATLAAFGRRWTRPLFLCLVATMLGVTCWLLYLQAFVLHAFCDFCLLSAALTAILSAVGLAVFFIGKRSVGG
jgi:uncharacterized membrane protein